jgi:hypothetical protein
MLFIVLAYRAGTTRPRLICKSLNDLHALKGINRAPDVAWPLPKLKVVLKEVEAMKKLILALLLILVAASIAVAD